MENEIELVERSADPDSPFQQRITVLGATLSSIEDEIRRATPLERLERPSLPSTPIENVAVTLEPTPDVRFSIDGHRFDYAEEIDWAERGTQIVRGDLLPVELNVDPLIPTSLDGTMRAELAAHLDRSLFAFATDARDRVIEGREPPSGATLADLAQPCPECGDWQLWGGVSPRCLEHETRLRELAAERARILDERTSELEERQRQVEELPIQRRRVAQTLAEIEALQSA
ncbi:MAG: hypothetical protein KC438_08070 [Thermomicrobiales bacterium]|nr:hypothetical protein [Thermomicrobiales bacterium]